MIKLKIFTSILLFTILSCSTISRKSTEQYSSRNDYLIILRIPEINLLYKHLVVNPKLPKSTGLPQNTDLGNFQSYPTIFSTKYHYQILESNKLYDEKNFQQASDILKEPYENEKLNPILLDTYARALYNYDRKKSYEIYKQLLDIINEEKGISLTFVNNKDIEVNREIYDEISEIWRKIKSKTKNKIILDPWFGESYWKIGTLYLDKGEFLEAAYEISKALYIGADKNLILREQALGYLTEAMFFLKKDKLALYLANETFKINPSNKYVIKYINEINKSQNN